MLPRYTRSLNDAEFVLERLTELGFSIGIVKDPSNTDWTVLLSKGIEGRHKNLTMAICIAALRASKSNVGKEIELTET